MNDRRLPSEPPALPSTTSWAFGYQVPKLFAWDVEVDDGQRGPCGVSSARNAAIHALSEAMRSAQGGRHGTIRECRPSMAGDVKYVYLHVVAKATRTGSGVVWTGL